MIVHMGNGTRLIGYDVSDLALAAIFEPPPPVDSVDQSEDYNAWIERLEERAATIRFQTRTQDSGDTTAPLLDYLSSLRQQRNEIEEQMILLVAFMRERVKPRPYTLRQIADAAGMSVSGTRTFYDDDDVAHLADRISRAKAIVFEAHESWGTTPGEPTAPKQLQPFGEDDSDG